MSPTSGFASFEKGKCLSLETFRKNGDAVRTPVWFAVEPASPAISTPAKLYIYTVDNTGKVKRIRNNASARIAPCDMRGNVSGDWIDARAEIVTGQEAAHGMRLLNKKYWPWKQIMGFFARFSRQDRIVITILPA
jgi:PPOX class probable F420-dependent enzyme